MKTGRADWDAMIRVAGIPGDEPVFLLRGQDPRGAHLAMQWSRLLWEYGGPVAIVELAARQADAMDRWPVKKPIGDGHLTSAERKQLVYCHSRRRWNEGVAESGLIFGQLTGLSTALLNSVEEAPDTPETEPLKILAAEIRALLARAA